VQGPNILHIFFLAGAVLLGLWVLKVFSNYLVHQIEVRYLRGKTYTISQIIIPTDPKYPQVALRLVGSDSLEPVYRLMERDKFDELNPKIGDSIEL